MIQSYIYTGIILLSVGFLYGCFLMLHLAGISLATDILTPSVEMTEGLTLVSAGKMFEFGFFSRANFTYMGIWYHSITPQTIVWVANRNAPINNSLGAMKIAEDGNLVLQDSTGKILWSTNVHMKSPHWPVLQLLDSGNLVLRHDDGENVKSYLWQSFDHLSDTLLPGMKMGKDSRTGLNRYITSWKSADDPSPGDTTLNISPYALPAQFILRKGNSTHFRSGPWNGVNFSGTFATPNPVFNLKLTVNLQEVYYEYVPGSTPTIIRSTLSDSGELHRYVWNSSNQEWLVMYTTPNDPCDRYGQCGANSICTISDLLICSCLTGYEPKSSQDWEIQVWSGGCIRKQPLNCSKGEGFIEVKGVKLPDHWVYWMNTSVTLKECEAECWKNCSCGAYANSNISGSGRGCLLWYGDLIDIRRLQRPSNQNLYIRVSAMDLVSKKKKQLVGFVLSFSVALAVLFLAFCIIGMKRAQRRGRKPEPQSKGMGNLELPTFEIISIAEATNHFSESNKIGEGGFGPVYKGRMATGQEIAVKMLSVNSNQGLNEFKNEVILISKLQHRNLVRLLGCCIQGEERMLIYEYMPNKSLNNYIYDSTKRKLLSCMRRFDIIIGIARGLLYLHRDSRLRIIHRDLKSGNILLDSEMNPKISDFGTARVFGGGQILARTTRVIGTYGYMAPEYVIDGLYSMKSDVFSFGVLVLEIVSGRRNRDFCHPDHELNLLGHAWKLWSEGKTFELVDELMEEPFPVSGVERCIQIGLLCVQKRPQDRPTMSTVLLMLDGENTILPQPEQPGFYTERSADSTKDAVDEQCLTTNDTTITLLMGR